MGEVTGLGFIYLGTECSSPTGWVMKYRHRLPQGSAKVSAQAWCRKRKLRYSLCEGDPSPMQRGGLLRSLPSSFLVCRVGEVVQLLSGVTASSQEPALHVGAGRQSHTRSPAADFHIFFCFIESSTADHQSIQNTVFTISPSSFGWGGACVWMWKFSVSYQLHKLIMCILCDLDHYQRMNQWCIDLLSSLNSQK